MYILIPYLCQGHAGKNMQFVQKMYAENPLIAKHYLKYSLYKLNRDVLTTFVLIVCSLIETAINYTIGKHTLMRPCSN